VLVGPLAAPERPAVRAFLRRIAAPLLAESASGLRADPELAHLELFGGERAIHRALSAAPDLCDGILRVGGVPVTRLWRDLEDKLARLPVLSLSASPFSGLSRGGLVHTPLDSGLAEVGRPSGWRDDLAPFRAADRALRARTESLLDAEPKSEPGMIRRLSRLVPIDSPLYLGNSLPIREWDLAAMTENRLADTGVNRGANGIDGQLSTFFGFCPPGIESWAVLGDLTALYDLGAPWVLDQLADRRWVLAIVNNGGGAIFSRMFRQIEFQNRHRTRFDAWAAMWDLRHETWESVPDRWRPQAPTIVELLPDPTSTDRFWAGYEALWK
jgi:2-succinyl-5-enolpyruvyl-6-hydroxy-3-cyclohexene-1-carboxylate synthase